MSNSYEETFIFTEGGEQTIAAGSFSPRLSGFENINDTSSIRSKLVSRLSANIFHHINFSEELKSYFFILSDNS